MYVSVIHEVSDPERFWSSIQAAGEPPEGVALHSVLPNSEGTKAVCLWEADSLDAVRELVGGTVGDAAENEFFLVDDSRAQGLPG